MIGGWQVGPRAVPWHVGFISNIDEDPIAIVCGGALLTNIHVLSAAHCQESPLTGWVLVGTNSLQGMDFLQGINEYLYKIANSICRSYFFSVY